ncbi:MAG: hypothetical protein ABSE93_23905 [Terriglobia bacterium]|jgi:hypothetical protein
MVRRAHPRISSLLRHVGTYLRALVLVMTINLLVPAAQAQQPPSPSSQPDGKIITVWKVGNPYQNGRPGKTVSPDLNLSAEALGYKIRVETFSAVNFADEFFSAFQKNQEPDILAVENRGVIAGITMRSGIIFRDGAPVQRTPATITGIGSSETIRQALENVSDSLAGLQDVRGWEYLIRTSRNHKAARSLALRPPECGASRGGQSLPGDLQSLIGPVIQAYLGGTAAIKAFEDADRLHTVVTDPWPSLVGETEVCGYWGSDHLAFVQTASTYQAVDSLGWVTVLLIFRKPESKWEFLAGSADPVCNDEFVKEVPKIVSRIEKSWTPGKQPMPARLLAPEDAKNSKVAGKPFREFRWQPSASNDVVAEVTEFARNDDVRLFVRFRSGHDSLSAQISAGKLPATHGEWRWRVWSISDSGAIAFSDSRSFSH